MIGVNPIVARELKERMRAVRAPIVLTLFLLSLGALVFALERTVARDLQFAALTSATAGRIVFHWLVLALLGLIVLMVPATASGAISSERERETFHLVQVTTLSPHRIVWGKLVASMAWIVLLVLATIPLVGVTFILGGVSPTDVLRAYTIILLTAVMLAMVSIGFSSRMRRTLGATVLSFTLVGVLSVGSLVAFGLVRAARHDPRNGNWNFGEPISTLTMNPFIATASFIQGSDPGSYSTETPFDAAFRFLHDVRQGTNLYGSSSGMVTIGPSGPVPSRGPPPPPPVGGGPPVWVWSMMWYAGITAAAYWLAVGGVRAPRHVFRSGRKRRRGTVEA